MREKIIQMKIVEQRMRLMPTTLLAAEELLRLMSPYPTVATVTTTK